ncbi:MAG: DUF6168 family protein [Crocinitomicaceae bacterium]
MKKHLIKYNLISLIGGILTFLLHYFVLQMLDNKLPYSLLGIYLFFAIAAVIIISGVEYLFKIMPASAGYGFLVGIFLKMGVFMVVFLGGNLADLKLSLLHKLSILIPLFFFMSVEALSVVKRLKQS